MVTTYLTTPRTEAERLATALVEKRLAACVNRIPCRSTYRWDGEILEEDETVLLAKTTRERYPALRDFVEEAHPHDVPCIERFDEDDVLPAFASWRSRSCSP